LLKALERASEARINENPSSANKSGRDALRRHALENPAQGVAAPPSLPGRQNIVAIRYFILAPMRGCMPSFIMTVQVIPALSTPRVARA
jgi:hypothetical protein